MPGARDVAGRYTCSLGDTWWNGNTASGSSSLKFVATMRLRVLVLSIWETMRWAMFPSICLAGTLEDGLGRVVQPGRGLPPCKSMSLQ